MHQVSHIAIVSDLIEEGWPSMDLVGEMLFKYLQRDHEDSFAATLLSPPMRHRLTKQWAVGSGQWAGGGKLFNADRVLNRFWDYPRFVRGRGSEFDLFHVVDHSYGQLLHHLPPNRTIITCHDLDTFRCLLEPDKEPRSKIFRMMMTHVLNGVRKAARVTCVSNATREQLLRWKLVPPERVVVVPNGVHPACRAQADPTADAEASRLLAGGPADAINLLHVGSTIRRKRIDVLLKVFNGVRKEFPSARLIRVGGPFTLAQLKLVKRLNLEDSIVVLPHLSRETLAAIYRQAALVLLPSDGEGFGLPVIEAMACGTPVVASDLPVLREVGGNAASYATVGDLSAWTESISNLIRERDERPEKWAARRAAGVGRAAKFSWTVYTQKMVELYLEILA